MGDMAIPDYQTLMLPVLKIAAKGPQRVPQAASKIADALQISADERDELLPSGKQRILHNRIHWAKFYLSKAGLLTSPSKGIFVVSEHGKALLAENPTKINLETLKMYPSFLEFYGNASKSIATDEVATAQAAMASSPTPEEQIGGAYSVLHAALKADLLERILEMTPSFFETLIVNLLVAMGYGGSHEDAALKLGKSGDGGVDGVIAEDRLGLDRIYVQAKRYAPHVGIGRPEIQGFVGSLVGLGATKGVFVTTSSYSKLAHDYASGLQQRVILIDGQRLTDLMIEFGVGVRVSRTIELKKLDEDFFETDA